MSDHLNQTLTRRRVLQGTAAIAVGSLLPKAAFASGLDPQPQPSGANAGTEYPSTIVVAFSGTAILGAIPPQFVGISTDKINAVTYNLFSSADSNYVGLFNNLSGPTGSVFRIGGDTQDALTYGTDFNYTAIQRLAGFLTATTNWQCIYGINLRGNGLSVPPQGSPSNGYTTTALAISEVSELQSAFGVSTPTPLPHSITFGNEPDNYSMIAPSQYPASTWNVTAYETLWNTYYQAILNSNIRIKPAITGGDATTGAWSQAFGDWTQTQSPPVPLTLLSNHFYIQSAFSNPAPQVSDLALWSSPYQNPDQSTPSHHFSVNDFLYQDFNLVADLKSVTTTYGIPWRMTETNSYWAGGAPKVSDAFVSALWVIDYLFAVAQAGGSGTNFHTGGTAAYSPIFDNIGQAGITQYSPTVVNPLYYGMKFFNMALDLTTTNYSMAPTTNGFNVGYTGLNGSIATIYCVKQNATTATLVMTNKSQDYFKVQTTVPWVCNNATIVVMTVSDPVNTGLSTLNHTSNGANASEYERNTLIGGLSINLDGTFVGNGTPTAYQLTFTRWQTPR